MSWDAIIAKTTDANFTRPSEKAAFVSLGKPAEVKARLRVSVPTLHWSSVSEGHAYVGTLSIDFSLMPKINAPVQIAPPEPLKESDEVESIGISARGKGDPVAVVVAIAKANHWSAADSQDGKWINLNSPSRESWKEFSAYREQISGGTMGNDVETKSGALGTNLMLSLIFYLVVVLVIKRLSK